MNYYFDVFLAIVLKSMALNTPEWNQFEGYNLSDELSEYVSVSANTDQEQGKRNMNYAAAASFKTRKINIDAEKLNK